MRLFTGVELPAAVRHAVQSCQKNLAGARWQSFEQLHLTVNFIGSVDEAMAENIRALVSTMEFEPFAIQLSGAGHARSRAVWFNAVPQPPLMALQQQDKSALASLGLELEERRYHPHVTVARMVKGALREDISRYVEAHQQFTSEPFEVRQVALFASTPGPEGSRYEVIARSGTTVQGGI